MDRNQVQTVRFSYATSKYLIFLSNLNHGMNVQGLKLFLSAAELGLFPVWVSLLYIIQRLASVMLRNAYKNISITSIIIMFSNTDINIIKQ